jgi:hypothetical protein
MMAVLRNWLRQQRLWLEFQEANREGWIRSWRRSRMQRLILKTPPVHTAHTGRAEMRVLTWRRDWKNLLWALKSFYHFAGVDYPLFIHDGGLAPGHAEQLLSHFPNATFIGTAQADARVAAELQRRDLARCLAYRQRNVSTRKLFDFYLFSQADYVISLDSDIVFFRRPQELIVPPSGAPRNLYNKDCAYWYSLPLEDMEASFGIRPPPLINSGLALVQRTSIDFDRIEGWLAHPKLFENTWVTEQTLHALCSTLHGVEFLPDTYRVSTDPGLDSNTICKHYPGFFRPLLYEEGMAMLVETGFLKSLHA